MAGSPAPAVSTLPRATRPRAIADACLAVAVTLALLWLSAGVPLPYADPGSAPATVASAERGALGAPFVTSFVVFQAASLLLIRLWGRRPGEFGIGLARPRAWVEAACMALVVLGPACGVLFPLVGILRLSPMGVGGVVLGAGFLACLPLAGLMLRRTTAVGEERLLARPQAGQVAAWAGILLAALAVGWALHAGVPAAARIAYALVFDGIGEELLFRGLVQTRLDEAFGRPWRWFGADVGPGLVIGAALFGVSHLLAPANPFQWGWFLWTFAMGLVFGWLRARTGSIAAPALVHGVLDAVAAALSR